MHRPYIQDHGRIHDLARLIHHGKLTSVCVAGVKAENGLALEGGLHQQIADVLYDNSALHNATFVINRGTDDGVVRGNVVVSMDNKLAGIVIDAGGNFARVRALTDSDSNIAVRVAGTPVYGFLAGNGTNTPSIGFFSDPQFQPSAGLRLITSNISGVLPNGIFVGEMINDTDVKTISARELSRVMVLKFDNLGEYR